MGDDRVMSADNPCSSTTGEKPLEQQQQQQQQQQLLQPQPTGSRSSADKSFDNLLHEYLCLELGNSKKDVFNYVHLSQSMTIDNINNTTKLLNTILHAKVINTQLEANFSLACLGLSDGQVLFSSPEIEKIPEEKNNEALLSIGQFILQSELEESNFKDQFFVTRSSFQIICSHLMNEYGSSTTHKRSEIDVEKQLLVTLTYLGTLQSYKDIGSKFNIAISTAHKCVNDVTNTLFKIMGELIYWPVDQQADIEIKAFEEMPGNRFPGILGVIGTVDLKKTCTANPSKQTKSGSSIAIQCVCNSKYQFYNVFTSYLLKSSVTTSTFLESPLAEMILNNPDTLFSNNNTHIIGPCCYPLLPNLMTPFSDDIYNTESQNVYNDAIKVPIDIIRLTFGKLLGRFKRLMCLDLWGQEKFAILIFAACCLHNLCLSNNDDVNHPPFECCTFKCDYYDEFSVRKRREICNKLSF